MTVLEGPEYQAARDRIKGNAVISMMAAGIAAVPLAQIAHEDGTPRFEFMQQANRAFDDAQARNAGNPGYQPYPAGAPRHLGLVAEAVLAERAAIREAVGSAMAAPGTSSESTSLSSQCVEISFGRCCWLDRDRWLSSELDSALSWQLVQRARLISRRPAAPPVRPTGRYGVPGSIGPRP